ncbi:MAG: alpha-amylase family glycosyl hydrolase [Lachnospiraceae bacterium]|nr:alpha-amylase family glycosyl hydrolase [Lachnospiraceae bacterium]
MNNWLESIYSDGTSDFVSNPSPNLFETVTIKLRMYENAPVQHVFLRSLPNGFEHLEEMHITKKERGLVYYEAPLKITENRIHYHFYIVCENIIYFYNQKEITTYIPDHTYDFILLADYKQPAWVKKAVFYQIFPERFCNGNPENDVKSDEYMQAGHPTIQMDWESEPLPYLEGYCMDFYGGDLEGVKEKIPYLKELGVTAVYLNPIFTAPSVHKYDCIDYFHVDPHFGGDEALADLSKALHENDMKLILDISINHTGTSHKWFNKECIYYDKSQGAYNNPDSEERSYYFFKDDNSYHGWFNNSELPTLNYTSDTLRDIIYRSQNSVLKKWLKPPYSIDGWRFDVANTFARNNEIQLADELWPEIQKSIRKENPQAYILAEDWGDCGKYLQGEAWDSPMNYYGCARVIRQFLGEPDLFMEKNSILRTVPYKMTAMDVKNRIMEHLAKIPYVMWENQFNLIDSHDVGRLHNNPVINPDEYRGSIIFQFILVGAASIYYGDEAQIDGLHDTIEGCRYPMPWKKDYKNSEIYHMYQTMAQMKAKHKALSEGGMKFLYNEGTIIAIARFCQDEAFVSVISTSDKDENICLPLGVIGAKGPKKTKDVFAKELTYRSLDENHIELTVKAHQSYFMECEMK